MMNPYLKVRPRQHQVDIRRLRTSENSVAWVVNWLLIAGLLGGLTACSQQAATETAPEPTLVRTATVTSGPGAAAIVTTGVVAAADEAKLSFKVGGVIQHIAVREGERVTAGQRLAELVPTEINAQLTQAQQLNEKAQRDLQRGERLYADQVIALSQLEDLRTQAKVAAAQLQAMAFNQGYASIVAPSAGTILRKLAEEHEVIAPAQPILLLGASNKGFVVRAGLADREAVQLQLGDKTEVRLDAYPDKTFTGHLSEIGGAAQIENGLFPIEIQLDQSASKLVSGLVAQISVQPQHAITQSLAYIPAGAVIAGIGQRATVYVLDNNTAKRRDIAVAFFTREQVAVASGVKPGEQVITGGALYLNDGQSVRVQAAQSSASLNSSK
jgi:multidrug efflux system membrane fusion protein